MLTLQLCVMVLLLFLLVDFKAEAISGDTKVLNEEGKPVPLPKK